MCFSAQSGTTIMLNRWIFLRQVDPRELRSAKMLVKGDEVEQWLPKISPPTLQLLSLLQCCSNKENHQINYREYMS